mmetsp:Transcript_100933/g.308628  ORF Transcript_100933/g.308628 Transcript_100933/m.308628 type:complete len:359 (+) Transcript_100933:1114-2190(+)
MLRDLLGHQEGLVRPAVDVLRRRDLLLPEGRTVRRESVLLRRRSPSDVGVHNEERRPLLFPLEDHDCAGEGLDVVGVADADDVPPVGDEPRRDVLRDRPSGVALDRDLVVVPNPAEVVELHVPGERRRFGGDALLQAAVAAEGVDVVAEELEARLVELLREPLRRHRHADAVGHALPERAGGGLHAGGEAVLRVAGARRAALPEVLDRLDRHRHARRVALRGARLAARADVPHARHVEQAVNQHGGVTHGEDETVAVRPLRILRVVHEHPGPQGVGHRRHGHGRAWVPRVGLLHRVHGQAAKAVHRLLIGLLVALVYVLPVLVAMEETVQRDVLVRHVARRPGGPRASALTQGGPRLA